MMQRLKQPLHLPPLDAAVSAAVAGVSAGVKLGMILGGDETGGG